MIVVDTSALVAIVLGEARAPNCIASIDANDDVLIAALTLSECLIVALGRGVDREMHLLIDELGLAVVPLTAQRARVAAAAYRRWGKRFHPASLNICDTFAYALAMEHACPLLFVGDDFAQTDVVSALAG